MGLGKTCRKLKELGIKGFIKVWGTGVQGITPLQQPITTLWSFLPIIGGLLWGITVTFLGGTLWLTLILSGSLPITVMQIVAAYQKYVRLKAIDKQQRELNKQLGKQK